MDAVSYSRVGSTAMPVSPGNHYNVVLANFSDVPGNYSNDIPPLMFRDYFEMFMLLMIGICGVVGNGTLIYSVLMNKDMRSVPNVLIANVAVGDLLVLSFSVPLTILSYIHEDFLLGLTMCKLQAFIPVVSEGVSVFTFTALSFDRYNAIVRPIQRRRSPVVRRTCVVAVCIWVIAICLGIPSMFLAFLNYDMEPYVFCYILPHFSLTARIHEVARCLVMYVIPLTIITCYYCLIAIQLFQSSRDMPGEGHQESKQARARRRLAKAVLVLVFIFGICWFPHFLRTLWFQFGYDQNLFTTSAMMIFQSTCHFLVYFNCTANPIALCFLSRTYRQYFMKYLCCKNRGDFRRPIRFHKKPTFPLNPSTTKNSALDESLRTSSAETKTCTV